MIASPTQEILVLALETARTAGLIVAAPLAWVHVPARIRAAFALILAVIGHRYGQNTEVNSLLQASVAMAPEFMVGLAMGFVVRLSIAAVEIVGDAISPIMGLSAASLFDPHTQMQETGLTRILRLLAMLLAVLLGLHRVVVASLIASFRVLPAGSFANPELTTPVLVQYSVDALTLGLRLALPLLAVLIVTQVALAFVSRAAPSMQIFSIGFGITLIAGGLTLFVALPDVASEIAADLSRVGTRIETVVAALVPGDALADHDATNKSEKATPEKRKKARDQGQFARGRDAGGIAAGLGVLIAVAAFGSSMLDTFRNFAITCFHDPYDLLHGNPTAAFQRLAKVLVIMVFPAAAAAAIAATIVGFAEAGFHPRLDLLNPKWSRLNPIEKMKRMLSPRTAIAEMTLAIARVAVVAWVAYATLKDALPALLRLARAGLLGASAELGHTVSSLTLRSTAALAVLAGADYIQNKLRLDKELMMSRQEIKEEYKQSEGDPRLKQRMRQRAKERLKKSLVKQIKGADVVVANPTHVSAALRYRPAEGAPVLQAKGFDDVALYIQKLARENGIPVIESPALARAIVARVRVGKPIPVDLYAAVAQVLAFVYRLKRRAPWSA